MAKCRLCRLSTKKHFNNLIIVIYCYCYLSLQPYSVITANSCVVTAARVPNVIGRRSTMFDAETDGPKKVQVENFEISTWSTGKNACV